MMCHVMCQKSYAADVAMRSRTNAHSGMQPAALYGTQQPQSV